MSNNPKIFKGNDKHIPTKTVDRTWIRAYADRLDDEPADVGKWLLFFSANEIDATWETIKHLLDQGKLGDSAKTSTARKKGIDGLSSDPSHYVICVYTNDSNNINDVARIAYHLFESIPNLNFLQYKRDEITMLGIYEWNYKGAICKYKVTRTDFDGKTLEEFVAFFKQNGIDPRYDERDIMNWRKTLLMTGVPSFALSNLKLQPDGSLVLIKNDRRIRGHSVADI